MYKVTGADDVKRAFDQLPKKIVKKSLRKPLRAGAKIFAAEMKKTVPTGETKALKKSVKVRSGKRSRSSIKVVASVGGIDRSEGDVGTIEYGRGPGGWHKGDIPKDPFVRPAFENKKIQAERVVLDNLVTEINKHV